MLGVIDLPRLGLRYTATEGGGAYCNGEQISVSTTSRLRDALVTMGDYAVGDFADLKNEKRLRLTHLLAGEVLRIRMLGSAAIDLASVAHERTDASVTLSNNHRDVAAGVVIAREAGAVVVDLDGSQYSMLAMAVVAAAPNLSTQLIEHVSPLAQRNRFGRPYGLPNWVSVGATSELARA